MSIYFYLYKVCGIMVIVAYGKTLKGITSLIVIEMTKRKTSLNIEDETWREWLSFVIKKTGSSRKVSEETANALKEYMKKHTESSK